MSKLDNEVPDISHLSEEEQRTILEVIKRQRDEEAKEQVMTKTLHEQFENYKEQVKKASKNTDQAFEQAPDYADNFCSVCRKTKIADGCGHACSYCSVNFCSRCGGWVTVISKKKERMTMWICNACRKQQEVLTTTGAWHHVEQKRFNLALHLEPMSKNNLEKLKGSASIARLESKASFKHGNPSKLKKRASEPQLATREKPPDNGSSQIANEKPSDDLETVETVKKIPEDEEKAQSAESSRPDQGVRRSSTHAEKRLHRQQQAINEQHQLPAALENMEEEAASVSTNNSTKMKDNSVSNHKAVTTSISDAKQPKEKDTSDTFVFSNCRENDAPPKSHSAISVSASNQMDPCPSSSLLPDDTIALPQRQINDSFLKMQNSHSRHKIEVLQAGSSAVCLSHSPKPARLDASELACHQVKQQHRLNLDQTKENVHLDFNRKRHRNPLYANIHEPETNFSASHHTLSGSHSIPTRQKGLRGNRSLPIPQRESHHAEAEHTCPYDGRRHHQGQHHSRSPPRKEVRKYARHTTRRTERVNENDHSEHHGPVHRSPTRCRKPGVHQLCTGGNRKDPTARHRTEYADYSPMMTFCDTSSQSHLHQHSRNARYCSHESLGNFHYSDLNLPRKCRSFCHYSKQVDNSSRKYFSHEMCNLPRRSPTMLGSDCHLHISHLEKGQRQKSRTGKYLRRKLSASSTDEEMQSTPDYSSCEESEKKLSTCQGGNPFIFKSTESGYCSSNVNPGSDKPVSWQQASDGKHLIGHMVLSKSTSALARNSSDQLCGMLGVKVVGGKPNAAGELTAYVSAIKTGSIADTVGGLKVGDEVIQWNDHCLSGATHEDTCQAVVESQDSQTISLIVRRTIEEPLASAGDPCHACSATELSYDLKGCRIRDESDLRETQASKPYRLSPSSTLQPTSCHRSETVHGKLQVRTWYDQAMLQLYIAVLQASGLALRPGGLMRNPYVKMYLLPDRSESSKKRTKTLKKTVNPKWNQSFVYSNISEQNLDSMGLELTVWDLDRLAETNSRCLGKVFINFGQTRFDDFAYWYNLVPVDEGVDQSIHCKHPVSANQHYNNDKFDHRSRHASGPPTMHPTYDCRDEHERGRERINVNRHQRKMTCETNSSTSRSIKHHAKKSLLYEDNLTSVSSSFTTLNSPNEHERSRRNRETQALELADGGRNRSHSCDGNAFKFPPSKPPLHSTPTKSSPHHREQQHRMLPTIQKKSSAVLKNVHQSENAAKESTQKLEVKEPIVRTTKCDVTDINEASEKILQDSYKNTESCHTLRTEKESTTKNVRTTSSRSQNKIKTSGSKSASSSNQTSPRSKNTSPSARKSNNFFSQKFLVGLKNKSQSSGTLEGGQQKALPSSTRSSEYGIHPTLQREGSKDSTSGSFQSLASASSVRSVDKALKEFVGGLGPGQIAGRQTLATTSLGELEFPSSIASESSSIESPARKTPQAKRPTRYKLNSVKITAKWTKEESNSIQRNPGPQMSINNDEMGLQVEIIRARSLIPKANTKVLPAVHAKVYLMFEDQCTAKQKTKIAQRSLNPVFHQVVSFEPNQYGNSVQVVLWSDYGRLDSKVFMGVVQVTLTSDPPLRLCGWYTLFPATSLLRTSSLLDSFTEP